MVTALPASAAHRSDAATPARQRPGGQLFLLSHLKPGNSVHHLGINTSTGGPMQQTPNENRELMSQARAALRGKWLKVIPAIVIVILLKLLLSSIPHIGSLVGILISGPLSLALASYYLAISRDGEPALSLLLKGIDLFPQALGTCLLQLLLIFLWSLLLIVPGIMAAYSYSMTFFILADEETLTATQALRRSKAMMHGKRWQLFCLSCRFIGWILLCILTLGIGLLWLIPYMGVSSARFYEQLKRETAADREFILG
jgi:uncharacterized membrane protein